MAKLDFTHGKVSDCLEENIEKQGDKSNNYQLIGFDYNNSVETERINVLPGPDYVPVRKINKLPMERPTTLAIRPNGSNTLVDQTENTEFNLVEYLTKKVHSISYLICDFWFFVLIYYMLQIIYKLYYSNK